MLLYVLLLLCLVSSSVLCVQYRTAYTYESTNCAPNSLSAVRAVIASTLPTCVVRGCTQFGNRSYRVACEEGLPSFPSTWAYWKVHRTTSCGSEVTDLSASPSGVCGFWWWEGTNALAAAKLVCLPNGQIKHEKYAFDPSCGYMDYVIQPINTDSCVVSTDQFHIGMSFETHCSGDIPPIPVPSVIVTPPPPVTTCGTGCTSAQCSTCQAQGNACCGGGCYSTTVYDCLNGALCPKGQKRCGQACYNPTVYHCVNGVLQYGPETSTPPTPIPSPTPPTVPPPSTACTPCSQQGLSCCGNGQCYSASVYRCWNNNLLCPVALLACGGACYDAAMYNCVNGNLIHK